jgi:tRNA A58 N-methylase Trm61
MTLSFFYNILLESMQTNQFVKATIGNMRVKNNALKNVLLKPVQIKNEQKINIIYRNTTNDITKNEDAESCIAIVQNLLENNFFNIDVFTINASYQVVINKKNKAKIVVKQLENNADLIDTSHNKIKQRLVGENNSGYLQALGISGPNGDVKKDKQFKYKQINRYVEIVADVLRQANIKSKLYIADMGSGKGYLTFALAEYLQVNYADAIITGVEMRTELVDICNNIAQQNGFANLHFITGTIQEAIVPNMNMMIALHACDTATDDAIKKGIKAEAQIIICAPCCHKQVRHNMQPSDVFHSITKHGILLERQAELITDALRALWLESNGYKTKVFDFVDVNDTPKNVMIVAVKTNRTELELDKYKQQYEALKLQFGVSFCAVEKG